ncbi:hypothetical protein GCM10027452_20720 [Micromonospora halotolerans]
MTESTERTEPLVELRDVKVHFPIKSGVLFDRTVGHVYAVDGVSLTINKGETYGLVGESGCGKSTLGRGLLRLVEPTDGEIVFDGTDIRALKGESMRRMRRRIQMIFQDPLSSLDPRQSVESLLVEGLKAHGLAKDKAATDRRLRETLAAVGLPASALSKYPHEFSGGQRQRIGIARALVLDPDLIVADEPVSALDVSIQAQVINLLEELQNEHGLTYLIIAHDLAVVRHIADTVGVMYLGGLVDSTGSRCTRTPRRSCPRCRCRTRRWRTGGSGSCSRATCPPRRTRRPAAGSTPGARGPSRPGAPRNGRRCARCWAGTGWPATTRRTSPPAGSGRTR